MSSAEVVLNPADRSLDCIISGNSNCQLASTVSDEGFGYLWSGVRATHGITAGRFWFSVRVLEPLETNVPNIGDSADLYSDEDATANTIHCCRIGVSKLSVDINSLGTLNSWGYGSTGKKSTGNMYNIYPAGLGCKGRCYGPGDEVACFVDLTRQNGVPSISYAVNGDMLGQAFPLLKPPEPSDPASALFPHILLKNLSIQVNFSGERPMHWPAGQAWDGTWDGYLPWQASLSWSQPATPGPVLKPFQECQVIMMVGLPGSGKSHQAARLKNARQQQQQHGSRTVMHHGHQGQQQQQEQGFMLLSPESITKQMKVQGLRRGGGVGAAAMRISELLGQAEEVFERLLKLAAQHPGNYIIDCCNVRAETRRQRLDAFREAGFRCIAGVVVERDDVIAKHMQRRDQALQPSLEDMLDLKVNFTLPEVSPEEFDEVQFLGSITHPQLAAEVVAAQRQSAQQQLQQLQDGNWQFENSNTLYSAFSSSFGMSYGGAGPASSMQSYGSSMYGPAAAADPSRSWSRSSSDAFHLGNRANSTSTSSSGSSSRHNSAGLAAQGGTGTGFTPYNPAEYLYRPPTVGLPFSGQHAATGGTAAAATAALPYGQYSQYAMPYDPCRRACSIGQSPPFGQQHHHAGFSQQHSGSFGHSSTSSSLGHSGSFGQHSSNVYVRQPSWIGPQSCQGAPASPLHGAGYAQQPASIGPSAVQQHAGNNAAAAGGGAGGGMYGSSTSTGSSQQQQQPVQQRQQQGAASQARGWPPKGSSGGKAWATLSPAAPAGTVAAAAAAAASGSSSAVVAGSNAEEFPSLYQSVTKVNSSKAGRGQQASKQPKQPQQDVQQKQEVQQQQGVQQQRSGAVPTVVSPFAAFQPVPEGESQASWPSVDDHTKPLSAATKASTSQAPDNSSNLHTPQQQQQQQQRGTSINTSSSLNAAIHSITSASSTGSEAGAAAAAGGAAAPPAPPAAAAAAAADGGGNGGAVQLTPELQQQLQELKLTCLSSDDLCAALKGQGPSGWRPRKLGEGSFGVVFGCCMSDLVPTAAAVGRQTGAEQRQPRQSDTGSNDTPANTPANISRCSANGHGSSDGVNGSSSNGTQAVNGSGAAAAVAGDGSAAASGAASNGSGAAAPAAAAADKIVAVKVLPSRRCTAAEFVRELEVLARCRHQHLVALQAYCLTKRALVFEYCSHGSLEEWLDGRHAFTKGKPLLWPSRITIARQVAAALLYLHSQSQPIIHRDVKPNNILLADDMSARLADVGLSRFLPINLTSIESKNAPGCFYYMPDEYIVFGVVSAGLDVFSFGLLLANILMGEVAIPPRRLVYMLAEQLTGFETDLLAAAAAAAGAAGVVPRAVQHAAAGAAAAAASHLRAGAPPAATAAAAGAGAGAASDGQMLSTATRSHWWLGVLANCSCSKHISSSNSASRSSSSAASSTPTSPAGPFPRSPTAAATVPAAAASKSWAAIASKPRVIPGSSKAGSSSSTAAAGAATANVDLNAAAAAKPAVAAAAARPAAATVLPSGLQKLLDESAGDWPPHVAVGLAMLALACSEPERRRRPSMKDVLAALSAMEKNTQ